MPFFAVDDGFHSHPKRMACGPAAIGLWTIAGSWSAHHLTDGFVPEHALSSLGGKPKDAAQLVAAGLWSSVDGGWRFHDFHSYNPTGEEVRAARAERHEAKVRAGRAGGIASGVARRKHSTKHAGSSDEAGGQQNEAPSPPDPTPPGSPPTEVPPPTSVDASHGTGQGHPADQVRAARKRAGLTIDGWTDTACTAAVFAAKDELIARGLTQDEAWQALAFVARQPDTKAPGRLAHQLDEAVADVRRTRLAAQTARHDARVLQELHEARARASTDQAARAAEARALLAARSAS